MRREVLAQLKEITDYFSIPTTHVALYPGVYEMGRGNPADADAALNQGLSETAAPRPHSIHVEANELRPKAESPSDVATPKQSIRFLDAYEGERRHASVELPRTNGTTGPALRQPETERFLDAGATGNTAFTGSPMADIPEATEEQQAAVEGSLEPILGQDVVEGESAGSGSNSPSMAEPAQPSRRQLAVRRARNAALRPFVLRALLGTQLAGPTKKALRDLANGEELFFGRWPATPPGRILHNETAIRKYLS
jgi:hypothetical protein